ncbi:MAG: hypothetical protein K9G59_08690 [Caulobacter sp.]|nr:hypothetical protein [Caulobacter sp.]
MPKSKKPVADDELVAQAPPGVAERPAVWRDDADRAETLAALEEYRRTGVSYSVEEAMAELDRLIAERRAPKD